MNSRVAMGLFSTSILSMKNVDVAPVLAIAWLVAIVIAFKDWGEGLSHKWHAATAIDVHVWLRHLTSVTFDVTTVTLSSSMEGNVRNLMVGSG
jgi:hypothetical protein